MGYYTMTPRTFAMPTDYSHSNLHPLTIVPRTYVAYQLQFLWPLLPNNGPFKLNHPTMIPLTSVTWLPSFWHVLPDNDPLDLSLSTTIPLTSLSKLWSLDFCWQFKIPSITITHRLRFLRPPLPVDYGPLDPHRVIMVPSTTIIINYGPSDLCHLTMSLRPQSFHYGPYDIRILITIHPIFATQLRSLRPLFPTNYSPSDLCHPSIIALRTSIT